MDQKKKKNLVAIGFGSKYYHQFTDDAIPLDASFLKDRLELTKKDSTKKKTDLDNENNNNNTNTNNNYNKKYYNNNEMHEQQMFEHEDIPNAFVFPLQLKEEEGNNSHRERGLNNSSESSTTEGGSEKLLKRLMKWRRKSKKQKEAAQKDYFNLNGSAASATATAATASATASPSSSSQRTNISNDSTSSQSNVHQTNHDSTSTPNTTTTHTHLPITAICAGLTHNALIGNGQLYITGTLHGKLYPQATIQRTKIPQKCTQISCGKRHILALFENKVTMSMGSGYFGQLGHGLQRVYCEELTIIERLSPSHINGHVISIEAGGMQSAAIVSKDMSTSAALAAASVWKTKTNQEKGMETKVYRWGSNNAGQCALDIDIHGEKCDTIPYPTPMVDVRNPETGKNVSFVSLSLGKQHSVGLSNQGHVYSWGIAGRCGHGDTVRGSSGGRKSALKARNRSAITQPRRVEALRNIKIVQISTGDGHTLALSESGRVFSWGSNSNGQLGFGHSMPILSPRFVADLEFGLCAARGVGFNKEALTKEAETATQDHDNNNNNDDTKSNSSIAQMEATANNDASKLFDLSATIGHIHYPSTPQKKTSKKMLASTQTPNDKKLATPFINSIHASGSYSAAVSSSGDLYTWGCSEGSQLGHSVSAATSSNIPNIEPGPLPQTGTGLRIRDSKSFDSRLNVLIPRRVECLRRFGLKVESMTTSPHFMIVICSELDSSELEDNRMYMMGRTLFEHERERRNKGSNRIRVIRSPRTTED